MGDRKAGQRRYAPKVRSGCITCKIRRVKCDESKPACSRCTTTGRKCDGYAPIAADPPAVHVSHRQIAPSKALSFGLSYDVLEKRTFEFFRLKTTPCLSGYFQDPVWQRLVLQACHTEPAVKYAVNALGALHEERCIRSEASGIITDGSLLQTNFPTRQYAKALGGLQKLLGSGQLSANVILLCALLCVHFESLQERFIPALMHAENAMKLLDPAQVPGTDEIEPSLLRAFIRIDLQGSSFIDSRVPSLAFITSTIDSELPAAFTDLTQARDYTVTWSCRLLTFLRQFADKYRFIEPGYIPLEALAEAQSLERTFIAIDRLLWSLMQKSQIRLTFREHHGLAMLRVLTIENRVISAGCLYAEASIFDRFVPEFEQIVSICKFVLDAEDSENRLLSVSVDEGMLRPLYFTATQCRDSRLRHSALALLKQLPANQGVWHIDAMTKAAQRTVEVEESSCMIENPQCKDIPEWQRIHSSGLDTSILAAPQRSRVVARMRMRPNGLDGEWMDLEEIIECRESNVISRDVVEEGWYEQLPALGTFSRCHPLAPTTGRVNDCSQASLEWFQAQHIDQAALSKQPYGLNASAAPGPGTQEEKGAADR